MMENPTESEIQWEDDVVIKFEQLIEKIPVFLRGIAKEKVAKKAQSIVRNDHRSMIGEKDMVDAFFIETPFGFHGPLKTDMEEIHIDYTQYGHPK
jgi:hypothetical protein